MVSARLIAAAAAPVALAKLVLPLILSDDAVLAPNSSIWGTATANAEIVVKVTRGSEQQTRNASANARGDWLVNISMSTSLTPATIEVRGDGGTLTMSRVLFGALILCSGQSNSE